MFCARQRPTSRHRKRVLCMAINRQGKLLALSSQHKSAGELLFFAALVTGWVTNAHFFLYLSCLEPDLKPVNSEL